MDKPLISIIVPCYNVEQYVEKTILSVTKQTYNNWELILVDDGSTDKTAQVCDDYASKNERIKVIHKKNGGLVSARNAGFDAVQGDWHMYLDGDDWIDTDTCEKLLEYVVKYPKVDIVFWKCIQELDNQSIKGKFEWRCKEKEHLYTGEECHELAKDTLIYKSGIATAYCKLIRTEYAKRNGIRHDDRLKQGAEGLEFSLRAFYYAKAALYVNAYFNHYRYNPNSISKKVDEKNTQYIIDCLNVIQEDINGFKDDEIFIKPLYQRTAYIVLAIAMSTYFHPSNKDCMATKIKKFAAVINGNSLFKTSIHKCCTEGMDKQRCITLALLRCRLYFILPIIARLKQYYLKKGKYNY